MKPWHPHVRAALAGKEARYRFKLLIHGKKTHSFDVRHVPDVAADGHVAGIYIVNNDITKHEEAEQALRESEAKFRGVVESVPGGIAMVDGAGRIVLVNREMEALFGYAREELLGQEIDVLVPERSRHLHRALQAAYANAPAQRQMGQGRFLTGLRKDGTEVPVEIALAPVETVLGREVLAVVTDVTRIRHAEATLKESEARFRTVCDTAPVMIWMSGPDKLCSYFNQPWLEFTGRSLEEELGNGWAEGVHGDFSRCLDTYQHAFDARRSFTMEYRLRRADGAYRWILDKGIPRFDPEGRFLGYIGSCVDITEERAAEEKAQQQQLELAHVQRLAAVGETAAALAHEINQPLAAIVSYVEGASLRFQKEIGANPALGEMLHQTGRIARRAADVVRGLRGFTRKGDARFGPVDVNQKVRLAVELLEPQAARQAVSLRMKLAEELPAVSGDRVQIEQLLVNLLGNGIEAMEAIDSGPREVTVSTGPSPEGEIEIRVYDSGPGIPAEIKDRLFKPFFTTKPSGLGMGLAVCRSIVERHGGRIWAAEENGPGASFHVVLPSLQEEAPDAG
ncbi:MAG: PAS domain-containing sensor histidine kinase [Gammaproteobacteria bacterium]